MVPEVAGDDRHSPPSHHSRSRQPRVEIPTHARRHVCEEGGGEERRGEERRGGEGRGEERIKWWSDRRRASGRKGGTATRDDCCTLALNLCSLPRKRGERERLNERGRVRGEVVGMMDGHQILTCS